MAKPVASICTALLALGLAASPAAAAPPMWTIRDADSTLVLFGSIHVLNSGSDWEPSALAEALAKADDLWFEIPLDEAGRLATAQAAARLGLLPAGQTLRGILSKNDKARLEKAAAQLKIDPASLDRFQPWLAEATLSNLILAAEGAELDQGVEETLQRQASPTVARRAFETPEGQIGIVAGASLKAQLASLNDTLRTFDKGPGEFRRLVAQWQRADVKGLNRDFVQQLRAVSPELYDLMIKRRNAAWIPQIEARLKGSGRTVMVVGVGHLVGPDSVPAMLRARGIKVEGP